MNRINRAYGGPPGQQVHYFEAGEGPPLLLLHSVPRSARSFRLMQPLLASRFRTIAVDLPGFGQSDPLPGPVTMAAMGAALLPVLDSLCIERTHVFGYHTGNKVAAALAATHPDRVDRLVLCGQIHSIIPEKAQRDDAIRLIVEKYFERYPESPQGEEHLRRWLADWSDVSAFAMPRSLFAQPRLTGRDIDALRVRVLDHMQALDQIAATYRANFAFDFTEALKKIAAPSLIIELVMPDEEHYGRQLMKLCGLMRQATGVTIMNAGKVALESHTTELSTQIERFCLD